MWDKDSRKILRRLAGTALSGLTPNVNQLLILCEQGGKTKSYLFGPYALNSL